MYSYNNYISVIPPNYLSPSFRRCGIINAAFAISVLQNRRKVTTFHAYMQIN